MKLIYGIRTVGMNPRTRKEDKVNIYINFLMCFKLLINLY
jgi:hypothetical protein